MGTRIVMLAAAAVLVAQNSSSADDGSAPDARRIVEQSIAATEKSWQARDHHAYMARDQDRRLDVTGQVISEDVDVSRIIFVNGSPFEQLLEHNGRPPSAEAQRKQQQKLDKLKRETPEQRATRLRKQDEERSFIREVPAAFDFQLIGEEVVNGMPAYVLQATPRPGYEAHGRYGRMMSKVEGKLWIDKQDSGWIKVDGQVTQPFSMGLFLARVLRGSRITMEQTRVADKLWMPERIEVRAAAKLFFVKSLVIDRILTYSDYRSVPKSVSATVWR
jgi:hypothetical protein